jgi:hypothetical protein
MQPLSNDSQNDDLRVEFKRDSLSGPPKILGSIPHVAVAGDFRTIGCSR